MLAPCRVFGAGNARSTPGGFTVHSTLVGNRSLPPLHTPPDSETCPVLLAVINRRGREWTLGGGMCRELVMFGASTMTERGTDATSMIVVKVTR